MLPFIVATLSLAAGALANTEIVNFTPSRASADINVAFTESWPTLSALHPTLEMNVTAAPLDTVRPEALCASLRSWAVEKPHSELCPHELWLALDLDAPEWDGYDKFTLRLSWPAFHPTDFRITIHEPAALAPFAAPPSSSSSQQQPPPARPPTHPRRKFARLQFTHTGVLTHPDGLPPLSPGARARRTLPVHVRLEPLLLGVLPLSMRPVALALAALLAVFGPVAWGVSGVLVELAGRARRGKGKASVKVIQKAKAE